MNRRIGCLALLLLCVATGLFLRSRLAPIGGTPFSQLSPDEQAARRASAADLTFQLGLLDQEGRNHEHKPFTLTATQDQLNTLLQDRIHTQNLPAHDFRAALHPGQIVLQATVNYKGFDVPATMTGELSATNGTVQMQVDSASVSGLPAPGKVRASLGRHVNDVLGTLVTSRGGHIDSVDVEEGLMTVTGVTG